MFVVVFCLFFLIFEAALIVVMFYSHTLIYPSIYVPKGKAEASFGFRHICNRVYHRMKCNCFIHIYGIRRRIAELKGRDKSKWQGCGS